MMLMPFYIWQDTRVSAHWNYSFDMHHWYWGHVSCFLHHEAPQGTPSASDVFMVGNIHCLPKCQATFFICKNKFSPFFQYKNICFLGIFQDFCFFVFCFFFFFISIHLLYLLYNGNFIFTFVFCIGFPWNLYEFFHYIFQNNSRKKLVSFMTF